MTDQPRPATEGSVMSERMTVEEAWAAHGSIIGLARLARVNGQITAEELLRERDRARAVVKQAILDEGLKEYQARVDGLVTALEAIGRCTRCGGDGTPQCVSCDDYQSCQCTPGYGRFEEHCWRCKGTGISDERVRAALAAVRESQVSGS